MNYFSVDYATIQRTAGVTHSHMTCHQAKVKGNRSVPLVLGWTLYSNVTKPTIHAPDGLKVSVSPIFSV